MDQLESHGSAKTGSTELTWPAIVETFEDFTSSLADTLNERGFCTIRLSAEPLEDAVETAQAARQLQGWTRCIPDFEVGYMGLNPEGKLLWMSSDVSVPGLLGSDMILTETTETVQLIAERLGFIMDPMDARTNSFVRMPCRDAQERVQLTMQHQNTVAVDGRAVEEFRSFMARRKLCVMHCLVGNAELQLEVAAAQPSTFESVHLQVQENTLVVFRSDAFQYHYAPGPDSITQQAWVLRAPRSLELSLMPRRDGLAAAGELIPPASGSTGKSVVVSSMHGITAGDVSSARDYWDLVLFGCDGTAELTSIRWDVDQYYDPESKRPGTHYTKHMGLVAYKTFVCFDNEFFGITAEEAKLIDCVQRPTLEVAYETLHLAGFTKETLNGAEMTVGIGGGMSDYAHLRRTGQLGGPIGCDDLVGVSCVAFSNRIQFTLGLSGPAYAIDTACSSSLYAAACCHSTLRPVELTSWDRLGCAATPRMMQALCLGSTAQLAPEFTAGLCGAHMLSHQGRAFTFDQGADGFIRAEGFLGIVLKVMSCEDPFSYATVVGTSCNQDGRSASLTAPHGPSQQECIRQSLREAGVTPADVRLQELHGTGTALGDPIEVGALRATLMTHQGKVRDSPLVKTSSKSNFGHMELSAGIGGLIKCIFMGIHAVGSANVHLRELNAHIDRQGYPVAFSNEIMDQGRPDAICGVSSFGFSGCNARGDVWAKALEGIHKAGVMDWTAERFQADSADRTTGYVHWKGKDFNATCEGTYILGPPSKEFQGFYIMTSANCWQQLISLKSAEGRFIGAFTLGDTRLEYFRLSAGGYSDCQLSPATMAGLKTDMVVGPGPPRPGHNWVVDARDDPECPAGTVIKVEFWWDATLLQKQVSWQKMEVEEAEALEDYTNTNTLHSYYVCGSWTSFKPMRMAPVRGKPGHYQNKVRLGITGNEEFHIQRDMDKWQSIYPALGGAGRSEASVMPIRGPDGFCEGKNWTLTGKVGDAFILTLQVIDGRISLTVESHSGVTRWTDRVGIERRGYYIVGTWSQEPTLMWPLSGGFRAEVQLPEHVDEEFQILVDADPRRALYPDMPLAYSQTALACGPDNKGRGLAWLLPGTVERSWAITLDFNKDKKNMVTFAPLQRNLELEGE